MLFGIVTSVDRFSRELLTPVLTVEGRTLYALATGWNNIPSKAWLKAKVALFIVSKQSLTSVGWFFFKINSPSEPAFALNAIKKITVTINANFLNITSYIIYIFWM